MSIFPDAPDVIDEPEALPDEMPASKAFSFSTRLPLAGAVILALVAETFLGLALALGDTHLLLVEVGVLIISGFFALGSCLLAGAVLRGRERGAWTLMGLACLGVLVAQGAQLLPSSLAGSLSMPLAGSYPSIASVALIAQNALFFLAFLLFPALAQERTVLRKLRHFFDGVLVIGSALVGAGYFILLPLSQEADALSNPARQTTLAMCGVDVLLLIGVVFSSRSAGERSTPLSGALRVLALGALLLIAADAVSLILSPAQPASMYSWLQALWNAGYLCLGLGAMVRLRRDSQARPTDVEINLEEAERPALWLVLPFVLTVAVAGAIMAQALMAATSSTQVLAAVVCVSVLVVLIGARHLVGLFEARRLSMEDLLLAQELALANEEIDHFQAGPGQQLQQYQQALEQLQETLTRFSYGEYQLRAELLDGDWAPLIDTLNVLLESIDRQHGERDRTREARLLRTLATALGRLALGELHDLPNLPPAAPGSGLDDVMRGVVQVRTRLLNVQQQLQGQEAERLELEQQVTVARQQQEALQVHQSQEDRWQAEYHVAQAGQEQAQRELQRVQAQLRVAEDQAKATEAALRALEEHSRKERLQLEEHWRSERQALEESRQKTAQATPEQSERLREQSERLAGQLNGQAEQLHLAAASLQTAAEVAQHLARNLNETTAMPDLRGLPPDAASASAPAATSRPLNALQMLEKLAGLRTGNTAPHPAISPDADVSLPPPPSSQKSGPLGETPGERVARRLKGAAGRAEDISNGLLELAQQFISTGEETSRAAEEANQLVAELKQTMQTPPSIPRTSLPPRAPRSGRL